MRSALVKGRGAEVCWTSRIRELDFFERQIIATISLRADMVEKRKRDDGDAVRRQDDGRKKVKKGFTVGPANLPDGAYKRKSMF